MFGLLFLIWEWYVQRILSIFNEHLGPQTLVGLSGIMGINELTSIFSRVLMNLLRTLSPLLGAAIIAGVAINLLQVGFLFTTKSLGMKLNRISPISGFKRMFSLKTVVDLVKSLLKIIILVTIAFNEYKKLLEQFPTYVGRDVYLTFILIMRSAFLVVLKMCVAMIFIATADFLYQWWKYEKDLKMTKQEVKDEYKMMEGDPKVKSKIRQKQRQMSMMRMMSRVPEADVVITNPTHYAVALKYDEEISSAPIVIAKGQDYIARKIKEVAIEHRVEIVENAPLAQSLYSICEIDDEIPAELYQAVADILVFVYKQKGRIR